MNIKTKINPVVHVSGPNWKTLDSIEVDLTFESIQKSKDYAVVKVSDTKGNVCDLGIDIDGNWEFYDRYNPFFHSIIGDISEMIMDNQKSFF